LIIDEESWSLFNSGESRQGGIKRGRPPSHCRMNIRIQIYNLLLDVDAYENYSLNFFIRMTLLTPPNPAEMERPSLTSFFLA